MRGAALQDYRRILDDLAVSSVQLASPLTHQAFSMARGPVDLWLNRVEYLELTCFYIPPGALERQLFEHAYAAFARFVAFPSFSPMYLVDHHATVQTNKMSLAFGEKA